MHILIYSASFAFSAVKILFYLCPLVFVANFFLKKVRFLLNIMGTFGIIQTAIEMAGI